jgi:peptidoglycan hydrolase-like protein with peptidoglycan-binding domain
MIAEDKVRKNIRNALKQALKEERNKEKIADIVRDQIKRTLTEQKQMPQGPDKIKSVQQKLGVTADGRMGPETKAAIKKFQSKNGLTADGILGPKTLKAMHSGSVKKESKDEPTTESKIRTPEHEAHFHSSIFEPKLVALNARLMSDWIRPKKK